MWPILIEEKPDCIKSMVGSYCGTERRKADIMKRFLILVLVFLLLPRPLYANAVDYDGFIVKMKEEKSIALFSLSEGVEELGRNKGMYYAKTQADVLRFKVAGDVEYIEPNYSVSLFGVPKDNYYSQQTNLHMVKAEDAWSIGCFGNDVKIGVIDSGVYNHVDLEGNILQGYNYLDGNKNTNDTNGHGTFVSGLIAAQCDGVGVVGIAHRAKIVPLKCFGTGMTTTLNIILDAIYGAVDDFGCEIINMSFGMAVNSSFLSDAVRYAISKNAIMVAAVGNEGTDEIFYPAGYENVIGVGSVNFDKGVSIFSQRNSSVFVTAPGNSVIGLGINGGYRVDSGTSFSSPLVSGMIAIAKCVDDSIDISKIKDMLIETSEDLGDEGYDIYYGHGIIDIQSMIDRMLENAKWFVSPIDRKGNKFNVYIYNNSGRNANVASIFVSYSENKLNQSSVSNLDVREVETVNIEYVSGADVKYFLWGDFGGMVPLSKARLVDEKV